MEATIAENLGIYPSEFITGHVEHKGPRTAGEFCFREATIAAFWEAAVKAISARTDSDRDGRVYTSEELEVYFGPWDVEIRHTYRWVDKPGGDTYMGIAEPYAELVESFEIVGAHDFENHTTLPGTIYTLNEYYKKHENEILKHTNHDTH